MNESDAKVLLNIYLEELKNQIKKTLKKYIKIEKYRSSDYRMFARIYKSKVRYDFVTTENHIGGSKGELYTVIYIGGNYLLAFKFMPELTIFEENKIIINFLRRLIKENKKGK